MRPFITGAERRRFLNFQKQSHQSVPDRLWQRYRLCVECTNEPITLEAWLTGGESQC